MPPTIVGTDQPELIRGTEHRDVIEAGEGADRIVAGGGNDVVCAAGGNDEVQGEAGADTVDGGLGKDQLGGQGGSDMLVGGGGDDTEIGGRGNDTLEGEAGTDFLVGGLGDDTANGGSGNADRAYGGLGNDELHGGVGDRDVVRGDFGNDLQDGGPGAGDVASFASATPPGPFPGRGVVASLKEQTAQGDGALDEIFRSEALEGSAYGDVLYGGPGQDVLDGAGGDDQLFARGPGDRAIGGPGSDECNGFASETACNDVVVPPAPTLTAISLGGVLDTPSLQVTAGEGSRTTRIAYRRGSLVLTDSVGLADTGGCLQESAFEAVCAVQSTEGQILASAGAEGGRLEVANSVPTSFSVTLNAGPGTDILVGGRGDDVISDSLSGPETDTLLGRGGDDGLTAADSPARLIGGGGDDLLVLKTPCAGVTADGGAGRDSVSLARFDGEVKAAIGGTAEFRDPADVPYGCFAPTHILDTVEQLEGTQLDDTLIGGHDGDQLLGRFGDDLLMGGGGDDRLVGGPGADSLVGGAGFDRLFAVDRQKDRALNCGRASSAGGTAKVDTVDPRPIGCGP